MRAMLLSAQAPTESRPLRMVELPVPTPRPDELLVRVSACGLCRTDLHVIEGDLKPQLLPLIPGHQVVGTVQARGADCTAVSLGSRVGIAWLRQTCETCPLCSAGKENLCEESRYTGYHAHGGFADYAVVPERYCYRIPETFSDAEAAPLLCAGVIGYRALKRSEIKPGQKLALYGFGSSAHITIQIARHWGCEVFVATRGEKHRELARKLGATWVGDSRETLPTTVDSAVIFAPVGDLVPVALRSLNKGGTVSLAGIYMSAIPPMDYQSCLFHEKNLRSVEANTRDDGRELFSEAAVIPIRPQTQTFRLEEANQALIELKADNVQGTAVLIM